MRFCRKCKKFKDKNLFKINKNHKKTFTCLDCKKDWQTDYYIKNKTKFENKRKVFKEFNLEKCLLAAAKSRAKRYGLDFNITKEDIIIPNVCPVLGIKIKVGIGKVLDSSPTIDRIDNNLGYIKENIKIISYRANTLKNNGNLEEFEKIVNYIKTYCKA